MTILADRMTNIFLKQGDGLKNTFVLVKRFLPEISAVPSVKYGHYASLVMFSLWILFIVSLVFNIGWLFWVSISFFSLYILVGIFDFILRLREKRYPLRIESLRLIKRWALGLVISPIFHASLVLSYYAVYLAVLIFDSIARKNKVRRGLIISGFIIILIGLIWEFCLID
ncbi:hypothetical protein ES703_104740 [subsurface metagenome]